MKIFVPGGAGYVGSKLVPALLKKGHEVVVYDLFLYERKFFDELAKTSALTLIKADIRNLVKIENAIQKCDAVVHLACISNDPSFELNPKLGKSVNLDCFEPFVKICKKHKIRRFIYASSSSVYGIKKEKNVTEDMLLEPLTDYSKFKAQCEKILLSNIDDNFIATVVRPATVCGYAPRQRLDVIVNILTNHAYNNGKIKVFGGSQLRPNIHIDDMVRAYIAILEAPKEKIQGEIFNAGYQNYSVLEISKMVKDRVSRKRKVDMQIVPTNDNRSYHISSEKIKSTLGFRANYTINDAVDSLILAFEKKKLKDPLKNKLYFNIETMKSFNLK